MTYRLALPMLRQAVRAVPCALLAAVSVMASAVHAADLPPAASPPAWAQPGSATHVQVAPPGDFHRPTLTVMAPIGIFDGQSDVGSPMVAGSARFDPVAKTYAITSAGYN
ncbi:MAG: hypothetical protein ACXU8U_00880, partial [Asticcacaulis sp.]